MSTSLWNCVVPNFWDGLCTHNPTVHHFDGMYYLYYMGSTGDGKVMPSFDGIDWKLSEHPLVSRLEVN